MMRINKSKFIVSSVLGGLFIGFINGFFGGGGGMIVVPLLIFVIGMEDKTSHATAIFIILPLSLLSAVIYLINGNVDLFQLLFCGIGFILGGIFGALILKKIDDKLLRFLFSIIMIVAGIKMLI